MSDLITTYAGLPVPSSSDHLWRYTGWRKIHPMSDVRKIPENSLQAKFTLSMLDGSPPPEKITLDWATANDIESLSSNLLSINDPSVCFQRILMANSTPFVLRIPEGLCLEQPLMVEVHASGHTANANLLLDIGRMAELELIISLDGEPGWFGWVQEGVIGDGAHVQQLFINQLSNDTRFLRHEGLELGKDTVLSSATLSSGALLCKSDMRYHLGNAGTNLSLHVATHGIGFRHDDHHFVIQHSQGNNQSNLQMHAVCDDNSRSIGTGKLQIFEGAHHSNASQVFRNLLLSENSRADSIPELEVLANEVQAAHGAASSSIESDQIFYLESRGLNEDEAIKLIVEGFLMDSYSNFGSTKIRDWLQARLTLHLDCEYVP